MAFEDFKQKDSIVVVYTGDSKGKTSASIGLMCRALGRGWRVAYVQFIKHWEVGEHTFIHKIEPLFGDHLFFFKGGKGFYDAGDLSAEDVSDDEHKAAARETYNKALHCATNGGFDLVICDEINNAVHDGLINKADIEKLIDQRKPNVSLCFTGRNFPEDLLGKVDIATTMAKIKHHSTINSLPKKGLITRNPVFRYRSTAKRYERTPQSGCPFCAKTPLYNIIQETPRVRVITNIFPYDTWDMHDVEEHLMIVPKRHVKGLSEMNAGERGDTMRLLCEYELAGYNIYARATESTQRTVAEHQHTHLIRLGKRKTKISVYSDKPYFLFKW